MAEVGKAYLSIIPSARGFASQLSGQLGGVFSTAGTQGGAQLADGVGTAAGGKMGGLGKSLAGGLVAGFVAAGASQIASAVTEWIGDAISSASDLEQSIGGVDAIFKDNADTIHEWAAAAADAVGLSKNEYNELATIIGAQLKNMGLDMDEVTAQTGDLVSLGADLAAQFGGSTSDAVSALSSLLRGERDPIERYGVSINEAAIKAQMAKMGLEGLTGEAEKNARIQATLALLTEQTADAQGAFARESDTLAGQQARVNAELENMKTEIGTALLPVVTELLGIFKESGLPLLRELVDWFKNNEDAIMTFSMAAVDAGLAFAGVMLEMGFNAAMMSVQFIASVRETWDFFSSFVQGILDGAAEAFGWVPGLGPKLDEAADNFRTFSGDVDSELESVEQGALDIAQGFSDGYNAVSELRTAIDDLPSEKRVTVRINTQGNATQYFGDGSFRVQGSQLTARATGGPVVAGRPYIVGENEPELFVPSTSGQIYNQAQLAAMAGHGGGSGSGVSVVQKIYPSPGMSEEAIGTAAGRQIAWELA